MKALIDCLRKEQTSYYLIKRHVSLATAGYISTLKILSMNHDLFVSKVLSFLFEYMTRQNV